LPKFKPQNLGEKKMQVLWLRFLTEINAKTLEAPVELLENPEVCEALKIVEVAAYTPAEMRAYDKFWDNVSVAKTLENARRRSEEKLKEAEAKLEEKKAKLEETEAKLENTVKRMKDRGFSAEEIADITGLPVDEIKKL
jgi:DNA-directed RNA polymerase specialized sigma24 family protein